MASLGAKKMHCEAVARFREQKREAERAAFRALVEERRAPARPPGCGGGHAAGHGPEGGAVGEAHPRPRLAGSAGGDGGPAQRGLADRDRKSVV